MLPGLGAALAGGKPSLGQPLQPREEGLVAERAQPRQYRKPQIKRGLVARMNYGDGQTEFR